MQYTNDPKSPPSKKDAREYKAAKSPDAKRQEPKPIFTDWAMI